MMAWGDGALDADYVTWRDDDKVLLLGENHMRNTSDIRWTSTRNCGAADITDGDGPTSYLHDGYTDLQSYPASAGAGRYLCITFAEPIDFDTIAIMGTNLGTGGSDVTAVNVKIADDAAFSVTDFFLLHSTPGTTQYWDPVNVTDAPRRMQPGLRYTGVSGSRRFVNVEYMVFGFIGPGATVPKVGEIFVGRMRQMKTNPFGAWDRMQLKNRQTLVEAAGGPLTKYVYNSGRRQIRARFGPHEDDRIDDLIGLHRDDTNWGEDPFLFCDEPASDPHAFNLMVFDQDTWVSPYNGPQQREFFLSASEQGPDYTELEL
jgi:hypothetical protein